MVLKTWFPVVPVAFLISDTPPAARKTQVLGPGAVAIIDARSSLEPGEDRGYRVRAARARRPRDNVMSLRTAMVTAAVWIATQVGVRMR